MHPCPPPPPPEPWSYSLSALGGAKRMHARRRKKVDTWWRLAVHKPRAQRVLCHHPRLFLLVPRCTLECGIRGWVGGWVLPRRRPSSATLSFNHSPDAGTSHAAPAGAPSESGPHKCASFTRPVCLVDGPALQGDGGWVGGRAERDNPRRRLHGNGWGDGLLPVPLTGYIPTHAPSLCGGLPTPAPTRERWGVHLQDDFPDRGL